MPTLTINVPQGAVSKILKALDYDPAEHGGTAQDKEDYVRGKIVEFLRTRFHRGAQEEYTDAYTRPDDPDFS